MVRFFRDNFLWCLFGFFGVVVGVMIFVLVSGLVRFYGGESFGPDNGGVVAYSEKSLDDYPDGDMVEQVVVDAFDVADGDGVAQEQEGDEEDFDVEADELFYSDEMYSEAGSEVVSGNGYNSYGYRGSSNVYGGGSSSGGSAVSIDTGSDYFVMGRIRIGKIGVDLDIYSKTTDDLMKSGACRYWGPYSNSVGNLCITGHNWRNTKLFSKVPQLEVGDTFEISYAGGETVSYRIFDKYTADPYDVRCLSQDTGGKRIVTLITCTNDSRARFVLVAEAI